MEAAGASSELALTTWFQGVGGIQQSEASGYRAVKQ
jgi:hypothetical protein